MHNPDGRPSRYATFTTYLTVDAIESSKSSGHEHIFVLRKLASRHELNNGVVEARVQAPLLEHGFCERRYVDTCQVKYDV